MKKQKQLSWKPRRRGRLYCAPACGHGCTWDEYQQAKKDAKALAASLGPKWIPRVHENMGWWYSAFSPCGRIYVSSSFCAFLGEPFSCAGTWAEQGRTAKTAVRNVIRAAKRQLAKINAIIKDLPKV